MRKRTMPTGAPSVLEGVKQACGGSEPMAYWIIWKYAPDLLSEPCKDGISADDIFANDKLTEYMADLIVNSSYRKKQIIDKAKEISVKVFQGLPNDLILAELEPLYIDAKRLAKTRNKNKREETKVITLYRDEMEKICDLEDDRLMRLAFATLIIHKYQGHYTSNGKMGCHNSVAFCKSDAFHIAGLDNVSGRKKNELWSELAGRGYLIVNTRVNNSYKKKKEQVVNNGDA